MGTVNSLSSGIDINAIVSSLMDVEKLQLNRLDQRKSALNTQLTNYDQLNGLLKKLDESTAYLRAAMKTTSYRVSSSHEDIVSAVLTTNASLVGNHQISVQQAAQAHQVSSKAFADKTSALMMNNTLTIQSGSNQIAIQLNEDDSLERIRDKINLAGNNNTVQASVLATTNTDGANEYRLILSTNQTGLAQRLSITGDNMETLDLSHVLQAAQDALFTFDGFQVSRSSNTITDVLDGLTIGINAPHGDATLLITEDKGNKTEQVKNGLHGLVDAYNGIIDKLDKNQSLTALRDNTYSAVKRQLKQIMEQRLNDAGLRTLADLGIKLAPAEKLINNDGVEYVSTGKLRIDDTTLSSQLETDPSSVMHLLVNNGSGLIENLHKLASNVHEEGSAIANREKIIKQQTLSLDHRMDKERMRLDTIQSNLVKQYAALDAYVQHYQQLSHYLEQQLSALNYKDSK